MKPELVISIIALFVAGVSVVVSFYFSRLTSKTSVFPVLVFVYDKEHGWEIRNVGKGPALNVIVAQSNGENWDMPTSCYPIDAGDNLKIPWVGHDPYQLGVSYCDAHNRCYTSICKDDLTRISNGVRLPQWDKKDIIRQWEIKK